jgi:hypothetical protein
MFLRLDTADLNALIPNQNPSDQPKLWFWLDKELKKRKKKNKNQRSKVRKMCEKTEDRETKSRSQQNERRH